MSFKFQIPNPPLDRPFVARVVTSRYAITPPGTLVDEVPAQGVRFAQAIDEDHAQYRVLGKWNASEAAAQTELIELCQTVAAGTTEVDVDNYDKPVPVDPNAERAPAFDYQMYRALRIANKLRLRWTNSSSGLTETLSISGRQAKEDTRVGRYRRTSAFHESTVNFGSVHWWFDVIEYDPRIFLTINWHNGIPRSDILFNSLELLLPAGWAWKPVIAEDRCYDVANNHLVRPTNPVNGTPVNHMLGKCCERPFRVVLYRTDDVPTVTYDNGLGYRNADSDLGDAPLFGPTAMRFPSLSYIAGLAANVEGSYQAQKGYLFNLQNDPNLSTRAPLSYFTPTIGDTYGGVSGGLGIDWHNGCRWLGAQAPNGLLLHYIQQLRWRSRPTGVIYCDVVGGVVTRPGEPLTPESNLTAGFAPWAMSTFRRFLTQGGIPRDAPWNFHNYPRPAGPTTYINSIDTDSNNGGWDPVDDQHYTRAMRDNVALAYVAADELAILYLTVDAELARMCAWNKPGQFRTLFDVVTPDLGVGWGRGQGWALWLIAAAGLFSTGTARATRLKAYAQFLCRNRSRAQMPSGLMLASNAQAKAQSDPPFGPGGGGVPDYYVAQNFEEIIMCSGMWACARVFGEFPYENGDTTMAQIIDKAVVGFRDLAWHTAVDGQTIGLGDTGPWKRYPLDANPSGAPRYTSRADFVPLNICAVDPQGDVPFDNTLDTFYIGQMIGMLGDTSIDLTCFNRYMALSGQSLATCQAALKAFGVQLSPTGSKIETFLPLLQPPIS